MRIFRHSKVAPGDRGAVVALGNFDGVHLGHQRVIGEARAIARRLGAPLAVLTFEPHPRSVFRPQDPPFRLTPFRVKSRRIEALGVDLLFTLHFDLDFARRSAEDFVDGVLVRELGARHVVVGYDFVFGHQRRGNPALLAGCGAALGFDVDIVAPMQAATGAAYSSTQIREHLRFGRPREAAELLGRFWEIDGRVERGDRRGRTIGFPTANLFLQDYLRPAAGVYAVRAGLAEGCGTRWLDAVANFGNRPTFGGTDLRLEAHLFDFSGDLYGRHLRVALIDYLRPERKFPGIDALKAQIAADAAEARALLQRVPAFWRN
ncbi:MAG TPA: bifunctional riboflavin kinase/FAD synthetase [Stellaceae bacterium]|nr:bifunctional riboflavin kinase/FAD synthetase [Stellaceae bacterium]